LVELPAMAALGPPSASLSKLCSTYAPGSQPLPGACARARQGIFGLHRPCTVHARDGCTPLQQGARGSAARARVGAATRAQRFIFRVG